MDKKYSPFNSSIISNDDNTLTSKLRRLRIQEALLLQSVQKPDKNISENDVDFNISSNYKDLLKKVKDSYINLKNLYDEVKANTLSQELFVDLDIDEVKKKIYELETNIKMFKSNTQSELANLKLCEQDINLQLIESPSEIENIKRRPKTQSIHYNAIVPSPVRLQMTTPFKCLEVQQFQEFMKNSTNRYGGWNQYNYNLFVKYWQKYFGKSYTSEFEDDSFQESVLFKMFMEEVLPKLQGITVNIFNSYVKWYVQYLFVKDKQQIAIDKWKWNKILARKYQKKVMYADEVNDCPLETIKDAQDFIASNFNARQSGLHEKRNKQLLETKRQEKSIKPHTQRVDRTHSILKPTKQWLNRHQLNTDDSGSSSEFHSVEIMEKQLHTPNWRRGLLNN